MDDTTLQTNNVFEIRRVLPAPDAIVTKTNSVIKKVGCDKIVLKTSYRGPQGPIGDTAQFDDLVIDDLSVIFLGRLI